MSDFQIYPVSLAKGVIALCPIPGKNGSFESDLEIILAWKPSLIISMTEHAELAHAGAVNLPSRLSQAGVDWIHMPLADFGAPDQKTPLEWPEISRKSASALSQGGRVLVHCWGGNGRSGMVVLRLMLEQGINVTTALSQLRTIRPGAVETDAQMQWAISG